MSHGTEELRLMVLKSYVSWYWRVMSHGTEELCLMGLKSGAKFEENLIFCFKNDKNLVNWSEHWKV